MGSRILLADDSITIQKVVNLTFADEGIEVVAVSNGDMAERRLAEVRPDLVLADIFMPGKNGYELCEAIKQNPQFRNVPVVLLVGAFEPFDQAEARRVRADAHLTKPFESRTLVETVRRLISASWRTTTGPIAPLPPPGEEREEVPDAGPMRPLTTPPAAKLDLSAMMAEADTPPVTSSTTNTGELASVPADAEPEVFDLGVVDMPAREMVKATLTDTSERFEAMELSSLGEFAPEGMPLPFGSDGQEMILDFDKSEPSPLSAVVLEQEPRALLEVDVSTAGEGAEWVGLDRLETRAFDSGSGEAAWRGNTTGSPLNRNSWDPRMQTETAFAPSDGPNETACATLLAIDEPLGDVLLDEVVPTGALPYSSESLDMEFAEPAFAEPPPVAPRHFDLVDIGNDSSSEHIHAFEKEIEGPEVHGTEALLSLDHQPDAEAAVSLADSHPASDDLAGNLDWTSPRAGVYSTAQLDSVVMPIDTREYLAENLADSDPPKADNTDNTQEAIFETATMWPEEELRFTPIDSDSLAGEEPEAAPHRVEPAETGFSFSSVAAETSTASVDAPSANATLPVAANGGATYEAELSPAAIEEIVRRVVAEMSESVVREVAWEVVPDCVERVIGQLTRESLSKRT
ncbi:MAG: response regulator [Acidobacteriota bacterium]